VDYTDIEVRKPWGREYLCYQNEVLAIWLLHIEDQQRTSLHCHPNKHTGFVVLDGIVEISFLRGKVRMHGLEKIHIFRGRFHSTQALSPSGAFILEIETPEDKHDLVRLEDSYGRQGQSYEGREHQLPKGDGCLWIGEPDVQEWIGRVHGCSLKHFRPSSEDELMSHSGTTFFIVSRGGISAGDNAQILWPGDVIDGVSLRRLATAFKLIPGTSLIRVTRDDSNETEDR
jgi:quercetin dioxygenase-like cupin family protein